MFNPKVAVVMRTKNRPITLERAIQSMLCQTFQNWMLTIVNDGGETEHVEKLVRKYQDVLKNRIMVVHHEYSHGMEAASNKGIQVTHSDFVLIHDDDDTLEADFLTQTVEFLESEKGQSYGGVATKITRIDEEIREDQIVVLSRQPWNEKMEQIGFLNMSVRNQIVPISLIYRRTMHEKVGFYNEDLPVLGDWEFYLRFLLEADIFVLDVALANYHHRVALKDNIYSNTIIDGLKKHRLYEMKIRNSFLRNDMKKGITGLGYLLNQNVALPTWSEGTDTEDNKSKEEREAIESLVKQLHSNNVKSIVIYGAGEFGQKLAQHIMETEIQISFWVDSRQSAWGTRVYDIEVGSIQHAFGKGYHHFIVGSLAYVDSIVSTIKETFRSTNETYRIFHL